MPGPWPPQDPIPVWHGSATSEQSTDLAACFGDPLFSANSFHPLEKYRALVGSPQQVIEKIHRYHEAFGNEVVGIGVDSLTESVQHEQLELFATEVAPAVRRALG
ncbi:hypothetical protein GCM10009760_12680 [Kitasatospora kazusensis]|uniref:Luciferase-like monooxygenase n=1 Tax=Kitasatospora kazusensis TaxID=407974 RepID=A0ABP5KN60_9ACTN